MSENYYTPSIFETFNARHMPPAQIARSFVPPVEIFADLVTANNHIIVGPRGSGKTTLLKMLTLPALLNWNVSGYSDVIPRTDFVGIFIPADRGWHAQLKDTESRNSGEFVSIGRMAFTTHVLIAFTQTIDEFTTVCDDNNHALIRSPVALSEAQETEFVDHVSDAWKVFPKIRNLGGLKVALRARLASLRTLHAHASKAGDPEEYLLSHAPFAALNFRDCISLAVDAYELLSGERDLKWAYLFDEFEVAPSALQREVLSGMRGESDARFLQKIALAPYNKNFVEQPGSSDLQSSARNDYQVINLWYPEKVRGYSFSEKLLKRQMAEEGIDVDSLREVFGESEFGFPEKEEASPYHDDGKIKLAFDSLRSLDDTFDEYIDRKAIDLVQWKSLKESERAEIRKVRSVVVTRNYFLSQRKRKNVSSPVRRSRKIQTLYTGFPTILALCEGNPRMLIGMAGPMIRQFASIRRANARRSVPQNFQAEQVKLAANAFRSLLKTIAYVPETAGSSQRGLLRLLDEIGDYFHKKCIQDSFSPQPPLSFTLPSGIDDSLLGVIGRALNAGAIIYVPDPGADPIINSLRGKRFRLSYLLAAYYKLPIMLGNAVSLDTILEKYSKSPIKNEVGELGQIDLFEMSDD